MKLHSVCNAVMGLFMLSISACTNSVDRSDNAAPIVTFLPDEPVIDASILKEFEQKASAYYAQNGGTDAATYKQQLSNKKCNISLEKPTNLSPAKGDFYKQHKGGVLMMGKMYKCGQCPDDHINAASAFIISDDGVCVSNYHVFKSYDPSKPNNYITYFVMDHQKNVYPVTEVLAASKHDDLAIFRIDTKGQEMQVLTIGEEQGAGAPVHLISHPDHRFYRYTQGHINRTYIKAGTSKRRQSISAEFAKGSSGAPVLDNCGNVVGIVAGTQNIYYEPKWQGYQSTIKEIIPVSQLKELFNK